MKRSKITGIVGTVVLHVFVLVLLFLLKLTLPEKQEEGGVPVMLGNTELAQGEADPYTMTEVDVLPQPETVQPEVVQPEVVEPEPVPQVEQPMITQKEESSIKVKEEKPKADKPKKDKPKKEKPKKDKPKKEVTPAKKPEQPVVEKPKPKEKTEAEKRAEAEKAAAQAAANKIAGAFGKGSHMGSKGNAPKGSGIEGRTDGNSNSGGMHGAGGYGTFDLNGRSLGSGGLPVPVYNVQDEGRVVVTIVVNPAGKVINTSINKRTNTVNPALRKAAEDAARKARFNAVDGVNNQSGTITYYFKLK